MNEHEAGELVAVFSFFSIFLFIFGFLILSVYGLYLAFSSHVITGLVALIIEPLPVIIGASDVLGHNIAPDITQFILSL